MARKRRRLHKRYRNRSDAGPPKSNPTAAGELFEYLLPGFGGFAATKVLSRLVTVQIAQRKPAWAKHANVLSSLAAFGAAWWGAHRVKYLEPYAAPITIGAGIAAAQTIVQAIPKIGWLLGDAASDTEMQQLAPAQQQMQQVAPQQLTPVDENPDWYTYDDKYDAGIYNKPQSPTGNGRAPRSSAAAKVAAEDDLLADLNLDDGASVSGWNSTLN